MLYRFLLKWVAKACCDDNDEAVSLPDIEVCPVSPSSSSAKQEERPVSAVKAFCLLVALSFHSCIEGFSMGLVDRRDKLFAVAAALLAHKMLAAFALGETLASAAFSRCILYSMAAFFVLCSPAGTVIGICVESASAGDSIVPSVCLALAAGTFLQISTTELLPRVFAFEGQTWTKHVGLFAGFGLMSVLGFYV